MMTHLDRLCIVSLKPTIALLFSLFLRLIRLYSRLYRWVTSCDRSVHFLLILTWFTLCHCMHNMLFNNHLDF